MPALRNSVFASSNADPGLLPSTGIISGLSAANRFSMVRTSSVSGATVCASPAYATMPVNPSLRVRRISVTACRARTNRDGSTSFAYIDSDRSSTITSASVF